MAEVKNELQKLLEGYTEDPEFQRAMLEEGLINRVALRVMQYRKASELSQPELAELLDTQQPSIARIEAGANVTLRTLARLAFALRCEPESLVAEESPWSVADHWEPGEVRYTVTSVRTETNVPLGYVVGTTADDSDEGLAA